MSYYISSGETLPSTVFVNKLISLLSFCASHLLPSVLSPHFAFWNQSLSCCLVVFYLSLSVFCLSVSLLVSFCRTHTLSLSLWFPLCVCLFGMVWLVLIYSHHYLVLGEDKHAFACLMNQTPLIPLSMRTHTHTQGCTDIHIHTHASTHTHKQTHTVLLVAL